MCSPDCRRLSQFANFKGFQFILSITLLLLSAKAFAQKEQIQQNVAPVQSTAQASATESTENEKETAPEAEVPKGILSYDLGKKALKERKSQTAIQNFENCVLQFPDDMDCHWELAWSYFQNQDFSKAKAQWELVQQMQPKRDGIDKALKKAKEHLALQTASWLSRSHAIPSFNQLQASSGSVGQSVGQSVSQKTWLLHAAGDTMFGTDFPKKQLPLESSFALAAVAPVFSDSDINFVNYEGTICDIEEKSKCSYRKGDCFAFRTPPKYAQWLKDAKINFVSLANNHVMDFGGACWDQTEKTMDQLGIKWSGRQGTVGRAQIKGRAVSLIAFHSANHTNSTLDLPAARQLVKQEKMTGALVIVSFHGGAEGYQAVMVPDSSEKYVGEDRGNVRQFAKAVVDAGADLVIGHGPHVVRGMEFYKGKLIAYSLGNFSTYETFSLWGPTAFAVILEVEMDLNGHFVSGRLIPTVQTGLGTPEFDPRSQGVDLIRYLSKKNFNSTGAVVAQDGSFGTAQQAKTNRKKVTGPPRKQNRGFPSLQRMPASL